MEAAKSMVNTMITTMLNLQEENGVADRINRAIMDSDRKIFSTEKMPDDYWPYSVSYKT